MKIMGSVLNDIGDFGPAYVTVGAVIQLTSLVFRFLSPFL